MNRWLFFTARSLPVRPAFAIVAFTLLFGSPLIGQPATGWTTLATVQWEVDNHETLVLNSDGSWTLTDAGGQPPYGIFVNGRSHYFEPLHKYLDA